MNEAARVKFEDYYPARRSGHAMAYDPLSKLVFLYGGYNGQYHADLWGFPLYPPPFPSLLGICAKVVRKNFDNEKLSDTLPNDLKERLKTPVPRYDKRFKEPKWVCLDLVSVPGKKTAASMVIRDGTMYLLGGSDGHADNKTTLFAYTLETQWKKINETKKLASEYNTGIFYYEGKYMALLCEASRLAVFDERNEEWSGKTIRNSIFVPDTMQPVRHVYRDMLFCYREMDASLHFLPLKQETPELEWREISFFGWQRENTCGCFWENLFFRFTSTCMMVFDMSGIESTSPNMVGEGFRQIPYAGGQKVVVSETGGTVQGEPPRFLVFGGYNAECKEEYTRKTFLIEVESDWSSAKVTRVK